jgi:hypothetical protein
MPSSRFAQQRPVKPPSQIQARRTADAALGRQTAAPSMSQAMNGPDTLLHMQGLVGNRAVQRMLAGRGIQPKLTVGAAHDKYEQEADRMAAEVTASGPARAAGQSGASGLQRQARGLTPLVQRSGGGDAFQTNDAFDGALARSQGRGGKLPEDARAEMESKFGADFSGVRVHTGPQAAQLSRSVNAEAFTHGQDIYMNKGRFAPETRPGRQLLAHELTHVVQQTGGLQRKAGSISGGMAAGRISRKKSLRRLDFIKMKRHETHIVKMLLAKIKLAKKPDDAYGHWWTELGAYSREGEWHPQESYGWWPSQGVGIKETFKGVVGKLNGVGYFGGGSSTKDPHHGEAAAEFNPAMEVDDSVDSKKLRDETIGKVRSFAKGFKGSWNWRLGWGKNCHTFQERMMKALSLKKANGAAKIDTGDLETHAASDKAEKSAASWEKIRSTFEEYDGMEFVGMESMLSLRRFDEQDLQNALADVTPEERESRIKILVGYNTGVAEMDLAGYRNRD